MKRIGIIGGLSPEATIDYYRIQGVILGCTELPLILTKDEFGIPFLNTTRIHAASAVEYSLEVHANAPYNFV